MKDSLKKYITHNPWFWAFVVSVFLLNACARKYGIDLSSRLDAYSSAFNDDPLMSGAVLVSFCAERFLEDILCDILPDRPVK